MVVLDEPQRDAGLGRPALGPPAGEVAGVQVGDDGLRLDAGKRRQGVGDPGQQLQRLEVGGVADVLAHPGPATGGQAERRLELAADGQQRRRGERQANGQRRVAAAAPHRLRGAVDDPHHRVIARVVDRAVVVQPRVGDPRQARIGLGGLGGERLVAEVAGGEHERVEGRPREVGVRGEQQVVQRGVRQQQPDRAVAGRDRRGDRARLLGARDGDQHHRGLRAGEQPGGHVGHDPERRGHGEVADEDREGLGDALLALAQAGHRLGLARVAGQVVAADPLHRDDAAAADHPQRVGQRGVPRRRRARPSPRRETTAAGRTPGTRWAGRGSGGRRGPRTRGRSPGTAGSRPSSCTAGRTGRRAPA